MIHPCLRRAFDVSIHAPREGCDQPSRILPQNVFVSIHAPREGCDTRIRLLTLLVVLVSIHAPREGCDIPRVDVSLLPLGFNPRTP